MEEIDSTSGNAIGHCPKLVHPWGVEWVIREKQCPDYPKVTRVKHFCYNSVHQPKISVTCWVKFSNRTLKNIMNQLAISATK